MSFINDAALKAALKDELKIAATESLATHWNSIVTRSRTAAYGFIVNKLLARGFTKAQIDQWDRGEEFETDIGVWWCLERGAAQNPDAQNEAQLAEKKLDRRWELDDIVFTIGYAVVEPEGTYGQVTTGPMDTSGDMFVPDPDDPRRGEVTTL